MIKPSKQLKGKAKREDVRLWGRLREQAEQNLCSDQDGNERCSNLGCGGKRIHEIMRQDDRRRGDLPGWDRGADDA